MAAATRVFTLPSLCLDRRRCRQVGEEVRCVGLPGDGERAVLRIAATGESPVEQEGMRDRAASERWNDAERVRGRRSRVGEDLELVGTLSIAESSHSEQEQVE